MLKHSFSLRNKNCDDNKNGTIKFRTESSSSVENGFSSLPDIAAVPFTSIDPRCSNISGRSESLQHVQRISSRGSSKILRLQYSGSSQASLPQSSRFSMRVFCKQQQILGNEVATSRDAIPSSDISLNRSTSPWDKPTFYYQSILCKFLIEYWKVFIGLIVGLALTLIVVLAVKPHLDCKKGMLC